MSEAEAGVEYVPTAENIPDAKFAKCPCGEVPTDLVITVKQNQKYGTVQGNCCAVWSMEFLAGFPKDQADLQMRAMAAWNEAPRG
jgi:hypothetical protein